MKNWLNRCTKSQRIVLTIIVVYIILASLVVSLIYNRTFGFGDQSLFYSFARNIAQGEAIYSRAVVPYVARSRGRGYERGTYPTNACG